jgi:hypothetical protein
MRSLLGISRRLGNSDREVSVVLILNYRVVSEEESTREQR